MASTNRVSSICCMRQTYYISPYAIYPVYEHGVNLASATRISCLCYICYILAGCDYSVRWQGVNLASAIYAIYAIYGQGVILVFVGRVLFWYQPPKVFLTSEVGQRPTERVKLTFGHPADQAT